MTISRRSFLRTSAALGMSLAWAGPACVSRVQWQERRDLYPQGVASGDPDAHSVILWTRRPFDEGTRQLLTVEVAGDEAFSRVIAHAEAPVSSAADWTSRVLVGGLKPGTTYWYRFTDADGNGSRVGRTITAPAPDDPRTVNFAFVSCQDINEGKLNAFRRMIYEDERAPDAERLDFVLHLGDFIYEVVMYPDELPTRLDRTIYEVVRIQDGHTVGKFHIPLNVDGYRAIYKAYLTDPDLQDARARWPFVAIWDNHEFSWQGWQSIVKAGSFEQPGQSIKVAANQAWFEYIPARIAGRDELLETFDPPAVKDVPIEEFDSDGLGTEANNLAAINSLRAYRTLRYGRNLDLIVTDQHSYRSADPFSDPSLGELGGNEFMGMFPEPLMQVLDGGRAFGEGTPPSELRWNEAHVANPQRGAPPQTILGAEQKAWFKDQLTRSTAVWKIWGNSLGTLEYRADPNNLPAGLTTEAWPPDTFANMGPADYGTAWRERGEICDLVRDNGITGFAIVSGDRHSFWAGYAAAELPPGKFEPVGLSFVGGSLVSPGPMEGTSTGCRRTRRCERCSSWTGKVTRNRTGHSTCCSGTVSARASSMRRAWISRRQRPFPTRTWRRTSSSSISAGTATPGSACRARR
ncbi:MAG TPA: alkaline phosphatase D family protein [Candidatus Eisenbacteria bacterium]